MSDENGQSELKIIKQLLIAQLVLSGATIRDIKQITGMSNDAIYKFLPKNLGEKKSKKEKKDESE